MNRFRMSAPRVVGRGRRDARMPRVSAAAVACAAVFGLMIAPAFAANPYERVGAFANAGAGVGGGGSGNGELTSPGGASVRLSDGRLFVADRGNDRVEVFTPTASGAQFDAALTDASITAPSDVAVDQDTGAVYVSDSDGITKFAPDLTIDTGFIDPGVTGPLAFDQAGNDLLVGDGTVVRRFSPSGVAGATFDGTNGGGAFTGLLDLATDSTGDVLVVNATGTRADLTNGTASSSVLRYNADGSFGAMVGSPATPAAVTVQPGTDDVIVGGNLTDSYGSGAPLRVSIFRSDGTAGQVIELPTDGILVYSQVASLAAASGAAARVYAITDLDAPGATYGAVSVQVYERPAPAAPVVGAVTVKPLETGGYFRAQINPHHASTDYVVQYGTTAGYGKSTSVKTIPSGGDAVLASVGVQGLVAGTTYHFRFVATNEAGEAASSDQTFTTTPAQGGDACPNAAIRAVQGAQKLADCRAYELVSPPDKEGNAIDPRSTAQSSPDGSAVAYSAPGAFSGAAMSMVGGYYIGRRSGTGWSVDPIDAPQYNSFDRIAWPSLYLSDDLARTVQYSGVGLTPGAVDGGGNLYLRDNMTGARRLVVATEGRNLGKDLAPITSRQLLGASSDLSHFAFNFDRKLTPDAVIGTANVFEAHNGQIRLAGVLPDGTVDPGGSVMMQYGQAKDVRPVSRDGRRIIFRAPADSSGALYMRVDGSTTIPISASQRPGDPPGAQPVSAFGGASKDGRYVFFTAAAALTPDTDGGGYFDGVLYRYDVDSAQLAVIGTSVVGVRSVSEDGAYAYFMAFDDLTGSGTPLGANLYVAHGTEVKSIATLNEVTDAGAFATSPNGRYFAFLSDLSLTGDDTSEPACGGDGRCNEIYLFDAQAGKLSCVSCDTVDGHPASADFGFQMKTISEYEGRFVSDDGRVFFNSRARLSVADVNGQRDIYQWQDGRTELLSSGRSSRDSSLADTSVDGRHVFIYTSERLTASDVDEEMDLYDVGVNGGLTTQNTVPVSVAPCLGDGCQVAPSPPSVLPGAGSVAFSGTGDPPLIRSSGSAKAGRTTVARPSVVTGTSTQLRVKVPKAGRIGVAASGLRPATKAAGKAGSYRVTVRLSLIGQRRLKKKGRITVRVAVRFTPSVGATQSVPVTVTFKSGAKGRS